MNLLELTNALLAECEGSTHTAAITTIPLPANAPRVQIRALSWTQAAYTRIQQRKGDWKFHWHNGVVITTSGAVPDYTLFSVREITPGTVLARKQGQTAVWPIQMITYQDWVTLFRTTWPTLSPGAPQFLCQLPNGKWRLTPPPVADITYEIMGDWYQYGDELVNQGDTPIWDEYWHPLIMWEAAKSYKEEYDKPSLEARINEALAPLERSFYNRYAPDWG